MMHLVQNTSRAQWRRLRGRLPSFHPYPAACSTGISSSGALSSGVPAPPFQAHRVIRASYSEPIGRQPLITQGDGGLAGQGPPIDRRDHRGDTTQANKPHRAVGPAWPTFKPQLRLLTNGRRKPNGGWEKNCRWVGKKHAPVSDARAKRPREHLRSRSRLPSPRAHERGTIRRSLVASRHTTLTLERVDRYLNVNVPPLPAGGGRSVPLPQAPGPAAAGVGADGADSTVTVTPGQGL